MVSQIGVLVEAIITLKLKGGNEWKWFCPSVLFYLLCVVPPIWLLELHNLDERVLDLEVTHHIAPSLSANNTTIATPPTTTTTTRTTTSLHPLGDFEDDSLKFLFGISIDSGLWLKILEQVLLLLLVIGRWMMPKGHLTHDQLSQLLLIYVGMAADIVEFYDSFNEPGIDTDRFMSCVVLAVWSASLLQFALVLTEGAGRSEQLQYASVSSHEDEAGHTKGCCTPELYGIIVSIFLQDLPFLIVRAVLIIRFNIISYTNMFFTAKNSLVIVLLLYRVLVVHSSGSKQDDVGSPSLADANANASARGDNFPAPERRRQRPETTLSLEPAQDVGRAKSRSRLQSPTELQRTWRF